MRRETEPSSRLQERGTSEVYQKNPRENVAEVQGVEMDKPSRLQGVGLPGGPEEDVAVRAVIPVAVDEHATLVDVECGVVAIRERFSATAEVPSTS